MKYFPLVGRILYSLPFLAFGLNHFSSAQMMSEQMVPGFLPFPTLIVYLTGILIIVCGLMVAAGFRTKTAALILVLFLFSTALFVHGSGFAAGDMGATANFMKDLSMAGAGLLIHHFGAGPVSMDARSASDPSAQAA